MGRRKDKRCRADAAHRPYACAAAQSIVKWHGLKPTCWSNHAKTSFFSDLFCYVARFARSRAGLSGAPHRSRSGTGRLLGHTFCLYAAFHRPYASAGSPPLGTPLRQDLPVLGPGLSDPLRPGLRRLHGPLRISAHHSSGLHPLYYSAFHPLYRGWRRAA